MGGRGFVGAALVASLRRRGIRVTSYTRSARGQGEAIWVPDAGEIDMGPLSEADAVVNLAGENLAAGRWNERRKARFADSRVGATALLCERLAALDTPPAVLVNASAVGFYGNRGEAAVNEQSEGGSGYLAELCQAWEAATAPAAGAGMRVVIPRFGVVLGRDGGLLQRLVPIFRAGLGGRLGTGQQFMPWITLVDAVGVIDFLLRRPDLAGPVNAVAPDACTNERFTQLLGQALSRPTILPAPAFALKAALGEMAQELLLNGANARPRVLEETGFRFEHPRLDDALPQLLQ